MKKKECIVTIEIDALGPEFINQRDSPFLHSLAMKSRSARIETTLTFTQFVEIFAGLKPEESGFFTLFKRDPGKSHYGWVRHFRPVFRALEKAGLSILSDNAIDVITNLMAYKRGGTYFVRKGRIPLKLLPEFMTCSSQVICEPGLFANRKTIFDMLREIGQEFAYVALPFVRAGDKKSFSLRDMSDEKVTDIAMELSKRHYSFYHFYFRGIDAITHYNGLGSGPGGKRLREIDRMIEKMYNHFKSENPDARFMIFSDHGMLDVKKHINVQKALEGSGLKEGKDFLAFYDSTLARFWLRGDKIQALTSCLNSIDGGHVISGQEKKKYGLDFRDNSYGDVIFLADPGVLIMPNYFQGSKPVKAMHTYKPVRGLDGMLIYEGRKPGKLFKERIHITKLYEMMARETSEGIA